MSESQFEPTIEGVIKVTQQIFTRWGEKRKEGFLGKTKALFHKFCDGINSHSSMLKILPEGSEYVSLFTGVLSVIINVGSDLINYHLISVIPIECALNLGLGKRKS